MCGVNVTHPLTICPWLTEAVSVSSVDGLIFGSSARWTTFRPFARTGSCPSDQLSRRAALDKACFIGAPGGLTEAEFFFQACEFQWTQIFLRLIAALADGLLFHVPFLDGRRPAAGELAQLAQILSQQGLQLVERFHARFLWQRSACQFPAPGTGLTLAMVGEALACLYCEIRRAPPMACPRLHPCFQRQLERPRPCT